MSDWIYDNFGWIIAGIVVLTFAGILAAGSAEADQRQAFMTECLQYQKQYECTAMWRAGGRRGSTYVVPVVMPRR